MARKKLVHWYYRITPSRPTINQAAIASHKIIEFSLSPFLISPRDITKCPLAREDCVYKSSRKVWVLGDAIWTLQCTLHVSEANGHSPAPLQHTAWSYQANTYIWLHSLLLLPEGTIASGTFNFDPWSSCWIHNKLQHIMLTTSEQF